MPIRSVGGGSCGMEWKAVRPRSAAEPCIPRAVSKLRPALWLCLLAWFPFRVCSLETTFMEAPNEVMHVSCGYCHLNSPASDKTDSPLWNTKNAVGSYRVYGSPTMQAAVGQPSTVSALCLSCHDGSFAADAHNLGLMMKRRQ